MNNYAIAKKISNVQFISCEKELLLIMARNLLKV